MTTRAKRRIPASAGSTKRRTAASVPARPEEYRPGEQERTSRADELLTAAIDQLDAAFTLWDRDDRLLLWNRKFAAISATPHLLRPGLPRQDLLRASAATGHISDAVGRIEEWLASRLAAVRALEGPYEMKRGERWFLVTNQRLPGGATITLLLDITERRHAEDALRESQARFEALFVASPTAVRILSADDLRTVDCNEAYCRLTGYTREQLLGRTSAELKLYADPSELERVNSKFQAEGGVDDEELRMVTASGEIRVVLNSSRRLNWHGRSVALSQLIDITEHKHAEEDLRANRRLLEHVVDAIPMSIFAKDTDSNYILVNKRMAEFFGLPKRELLQRHTSRLPNPGAALRKSLRDDEWVFENRRTLDQPDTLLPRPDGSLVHYHSTKIPLFDDSGELLGLLGVNRDITEEKRAEDERRATQQKIEELNESLERTVARRTGELREANEELVRALGDLKESHDQLLRSEKLAALGRLVAGVAHELNTPIGNGLLSATTLHDHTEAFAGQAASGSIKRSSLEAFIAQTREASAILLRNLDKAAELISSFKRLAADQTSSQRRMFRLQEVVQEVLLAHRPMLKRSPIEVGIDIPADIRLDGYPGPLGQVLGNLITNAVLHGYDGFPNGSVSVSARLDGEQRVEIEVRDQGRGISETDLKRIFDPFFTTRLGRGGTGLGLGICHNIITDALGGTISVSSSIGEGSSFILNLPVRAPENAARPAE